MQNLIADAVPHSDGTLCHTLTSPYQAGETAIHVLRPDDFDPGQTARVLYVLPVEPDNGQQWGDALAAVRQLDLHNTHRLICIKPTFSQSPWYADHPSDRHIRQESHFLKVVVPFVDATYSSTPHRRLLLGFSKSGWGAFSLLLRHPARFAKAAAFDAPLGAERPYRYGMSEVFETQDNMNRYCVVDLLRESAESLAGESRLALCDHCEFRGQMQFLHYYLLKLGIPHANHDVCRDRHRWDSGWLPAAVDFLVSE